MHTNLTRYAAAVTLLVAFGSGCTGDDVEPDVEQPTATATETAPTADEPADTEQPTATEAPTATEEPITTESPIQGTAQTFIVAPQEPLEVATGEAAEFSVGATYGDQPVPSELFLGVIPCDNYDFDTATFVDADDDSTVDGFDEDFGPRIGSVNGEPYENAEDVWPTQVQVQDDELTFTVTSSESACGIPVVFDDVDDSGELELDDQGRADEPYGVGQVTFGS